MADAETKKAPRISSSPQKRGKPSEGGVPETLEAMEAVEIVEPTVTKVRSVGPPPLPSVRPHRSDAPGSAPLDKERTPDKAPDKEPATEGAASGELHAPPPPSRPHSPSGPLGSQQDAPIVSASAHSPKPEPSEGGSSGTSGASAPTASATATSGSEPGPSVAESANSRTASKVPLSQAPQVGPVSSTTSPLSPPSNPARSKPAEIPVEPPVEAEVHSEIARLKAEVATLRNNTQGPGFALRALPFVAIALLSGTLGYLLGDSIESRQRAEIRKVAMDRYYAAGTRPADEQKEILGFIQKELAKDDAELSRWAKSQVSVIDERVAATQEREAALKVRVGELQTELAQKTTEGLQLATDKARLEQRIEALESVEKKLDRLRNSNALLVQAKVAIERLNKQLSDIEESPAAQTVTGKP